MHHRAISLLVLVLGLSETAAVGAWSDRTVGLPPTEVISAKEMGLGGSIMSIAQDKLGRIFIGSNRLSVFDGQNWRSFAKPNQDCLYSLAMGSDGKLWAGASNELGYFEETSAGVFQYYSLLSHLPDEARDIGVVWGCAPIGSDTYFICRNKLLKWNGGNFQVTPFQTQLRLVTMRVDGEWWFYHYETGLYRLTENGPKLEIPATELQKISVMGMFRDERGLVVVGNRGFFRPGNPATLISREDLNHYLEEHIVSDFDVLPNGNCVISTVSGGLVLASHTGQLIRTWDANGGLPAHGIMSLSTSYSGEVFGVTSTAFFHFPAAGEATIFDANNGLTGEAVNFLATGKSTFYAATDEGIFQQDISTEGNSLFKKTPGLNDLFSYILPRHDGLLLCRFGGIDQFDGTTMHSIYREHVGNSFLILAKRTDPKIFYISESYGIALLKEETDGSLHHQPLVKLPDVCLSLYEDPVGRLWIGTVTRGAFVYNPATNILLPVKSPNNGAELPGLVKILGNDEGIIIMFEGGALRVASDGYSLTQLKDVPAFIPLEVTYTPNGQDILVTYQRTRGADQLSYGIGILSIGSANRTGWQELDIPSVEAIGPVRSLTFSEENDHPILWLGGSEGLLRVDYDKIKTLQPPPAPLIRSNDPLTSRPVDHFEHSFPFKDHRVEVMVYTGDYVRGKDWLIQTRLDGGEWSNPSPRRSFEFTNLSEGDYRFEARAVNSANMESAPATLTFTILPPWYRSGGAYTGYGSSLALAVFGFIRVRERQIRSRNRELETQVASRTAELVKANAAKDEFLSSVSHEIRNPMNGVIGIAESLKTAGLDPESRRKFELLRQCAGHLSLLLESLLDFSRLQAGAVELESKPFDLPALMDSVIAFTAAESEQRGLPVEIAISPAVPRQLTGDPLRIRQILLNFVGNALNFSEHGKICVTVWCKSIAPGRTEVFFAVSDEGPGIAPEEQKKLFTRFERGAAAQQGRVPGTGLGLALCRTLAERMGGRIWLESELGAGSCFYFSAPFVIAENAILPVPVVHQPGSKTCQTALVVDDEEYNRIALGDLLEFIGFTVQTASEGDHALALAETHDFDIIFLDFAMPGLSGAEVARAVRTLPNRSAQALIFAVTAFNTSDKRAQCLSAGMNGFLGKPITMERLRQALSTVSAPESISSPSPMADADSSPTSPEARLQRLAARKGISYHAELALYLSEFTTELEQLTHALKQENTRDSGHYAHLLYGRCSFIQERELEVILRKIAATTGAGQWEAARALGREIPPLLADLHFRLAATTPIAPPA